MYHENTKFYYKSTMGRVLGKALEERKAAQIQEQRNRPRVMSGRARGVNEIFLHSEDGENAFSWRLGKAF